MFDTGHNWLAVPTGGNAVKVCRSLQCTAQHILYHNTWCQNGNHFFPFPRRYWLQAVNSHRRDSLRKNCFKEISLRQSLDFSWHCPRIEYNKHRMQLGNEESGGGQDIAQNSPGSRPCGDVAGKPKPMYYPEGISQSSKVMSAIGYISDSDAIVKSFWPLFQHHCMAALKLSEWSPLPSALSGKDLPGGQTQKLNVHWTRKINRHPVEIDEDRSPERISDTVDWLNWNWDLDNRNDSKDNCAGDFDNDIDQPNIIDDMQCTEQRDVSAAPNVPGLIRSTQISKTQAEKVFMTVNANQMRWNMGGNKM